MKTIKLTKQDRKNIALIQLFNKHGGAAAPGAEDTPASLVSNRLRHAVEQRWHEAARWRGDTVLREMGMTPDGVPMVFRLALGCREITRETGVYMTAAGPDGVTNKCWPVFDPPKTKAGDLDDEIPF